MTKQTTEYTFLRCYTDVIADTQCGLTITIGGRYTTLALNGATRPEGAIIRITDVAVGEQIRVLLEKLNNQFHTFEYNYAVSLHLNREYLVLILPVLRECKSLVKIPVLLGAENDTDVCADSASISPRVLDQYIGMFKRCDVMFAHKMYNGTQWVILSAEFSPSRIGFYEILGDEGRIYEVVDDEDEETMRTVISKLKKAGSEASKRYAVHLSDIDDTPSVAFYEDDITPYWISVRRTGSTTSKAGKSPKVADVANVSTVANATVANTSVANTSVANTSVANTSVANATNEPAKAESPKTQSPPQVIQPTMSLRTLAQRVQKMEERMTRESALLQKIASDVALLRSAPSETGEFAKVYDAIGDLQVQISRLYVELSDDEDDSLGDA